MTSLCNQRAKVTLRERRQKIDLGDALRAIITGFPEIRRRPSEIEPSKTWFMIDVRDLVYLIITSPLDFKSLDTVKRYSRPATIWKSNAAFRVGM
jgi:hypothetical protein